MLLVRDPDHVQRITVPEIQDLVRQRFAYLVEDEPYDPQTMAYFIVVEDGDQLDVVNEQVGFDILCNRFDETRYDQAGFHQSFEVLEEHQTCYEIMFILSDDGFGVDIFVPKAAEIPSDLREMCERYAIRSPEGHAT